MFLVVDRQTNFIVLKLVWARIPTSGQTVSAEHSRIGSAMGIFSSVGQTKGRCPLLVQQFLVSVGCVCPN